MPRRSRTRARQDAAPIAAKYPPYHTRWRCRATVGEAPYDVCEAPNELWSDACCRCEHLRGEGDQAINEKGDSVGVYVTAQSVEYGMTAEGVEVMRHDTWGWKCFVCQHYMRINKKKCTSSYCNRDSATPDPRNTLSRAVRLFGVDGQNRPVRFKDIGRFTGEMGVAYYGDPEEYVPDDRFDPPLTRFITDP